jgi:DNA-binding NtrC family response regulator
MSYRLLLIEASSSCLVLPFAREGPRNGFLCQRACWDSFEPEALRRAADLIVPVAAPATPPRALHLFEWLGRHGLATPTLAILPADAGEGIVRSVAEAVDDFVLWPASDAELLGRVDRILGGSRQPRREAAHSRLSIELGLTQLAGRAPAFLRSLEQLPRLGQCDGPVLITGETGTGKELCARALHHLSRRRANPFVAVDCGAYPDHLFENELFGHARGAYTDAHAEQKGLAALAEGGTLFLDEVENLSLAAQAKLLRFLQERTYKPLGSERFSRADVRVLAATNDDLKACVRALRFRADLYFRLNVLRLHLPPLRERPGDVALLARHILASLCAGQPRKVLSPAALRQLEGHDWPGNVRELHNVLQRAVVFSDGPQILPAHVDLGTEANAAHGEPPRSETRFGEARASVLASFESRYVRELLERFGGNVTRAAAAAGKERRAFGRLVKKHGLKTTGP